MSLNVPKKTTFLSRALFLRVVRVGGWDRIRRCLQLGDESAHCEHVIHHMRLVTDELLLITNRPTEYAHLGLPMHSDRVPDAGALGGIYTGLTYASHDAVLCVACDSPFLRPKLLTYLVAILG